MVVVAVALFNVPSPGVALRSVLSAQQTGLQDLLLPGPVLLELRSQVRTDRGRSGLRSDIDNYLQVYHSREEMLELSLCECPHPEPGKGHRTQGTDQGLELSEDS